MSTRSFDAADTLAIKPTHYKPAENLRVAPQVAPLTVSIFPFSTRAPPSPLRRTISGGANTFSHDHGPAYA